MNLAIIGSGYVGLVSGACFAKFGHKVTCIDKDEEKIKRLKAGEIPIYEPGLDILVKENVASGRLSFATNLSEAIKGVKAVFIAVGTPESRRGEGYADMKYVFGVAKEIAPLIKDYAVVIDKSTVPVGTADRVEEIIKEINPKADFDVVSNPEFLREGSAITDFERPDRIVVGAKTKKALEVMREIYNPLNVSRDQLVTMDPKTAEMVKLNSNAFLAVKIAFANEIADLAEKIGADGIKALVAMGMDGRIGSKFLHPGPGYGGSCFPKDTKSLEKTGQEAGANVTIVEAAIKSNSGRKARMVRKITKAMGGKVSGKRIACLGLTFKSNTDDMRESPALVILPSLVEKGARVVAYDPKGAQEAKKHMDDIEYATSSYEACKGIDCLIIMTEWDEFKGLDLEKIKNLMNGDTIVDLRNLYYKERNKIKNLGFNYSGVGF
jgi:UDPglucose 6-dehydrogenase